MANKRQNASKGSVPKGTYVFRNQLCARDGTVLGTFSAHWPAVAALIRQSNPDFVSTGGDKPEDLAVERRIRESGVLA